MIVKYARPRLTELGEQLHVDVQHKTFLHFILHMCIRYEKGEVSYETIQNESLTREITEMLKKIKENRQARAATERMLEDAAEARLARIDDGSESGSQ